MTSENLALQLRKAAICCPVATPCAAQFSRPVAPHVRWWRAVVDVGFDEVEQYSLANVVPCVVDAWIVPEPVMPEHHSAGWTLR